LCVSLSGIDFQGRRHFGLSGLLIFSGTSEGPVEIDGLSSGRIQPIIDMGLYGQMNIGRSLHFGLGFRVASIIVATMTWPTVYAELDLWRFSLNAQLGGGFYAGLAGFYPFFLVGDSVIPEVSLWFRFSHSRIGVGALSFLSVSSLNTEFFKEISAADPIKNHKVLLYLSYVWSIK
jgi:hypothetical protein